MQAVAVTHSRGRAAAAAVLGVPSGQMKATDSLQVVTGQARVVAMGQHKKSPLLQLTLVWFRWSLKM
jgi:hypothetical protein